VLSRLVAIHAALEHIYACLDGSPQLTGWQADFLNSLVKQFHRGLPLTAKQAAVLNRIWPQGGTDA
jgi:hypothetical protein